VLLRGDGAGRQPLPQFECCSVVPAVHGESAFAEPGAGGEPDPGVELASAVAGESKAAGAHPQRVRGAQRWIVAGEGLVEVDGHRLWRGHLPVGRGAWERFVPPRICRTHERMLLLTSCGW